MDTLYLISFLAIAPFAMALLAASLRRRRSASASPGHSWPGRGDFAGEAVDLSRLLPDIAESLMPLAQELGTRIQFAVSPGRTVRAHAGGLAAAVRETMETAIRAAPGGAVLVSVLPLGQQIHIAVTDDAPHADRAARAAQVRGAEAAIALRGGSVAVETRPGQGTTVTLRLPALPGVPEAGAEGVAEDARAGEETAGPSEPPMAAHSV